MSEEESRPSSASSDESSSSSIDSHEKLLQNRKLIRHLLQNSNHGSPGDIWYLISSDYLNKFFNLPVSSFDDLILQLGPVDCTAIADENGQLYPEHDEPIGTYNVIPEIFNCFTSWFGIKGSAISRYLIENKKTGQNEVERFPLTFHLHQLSKKVPHQSLTSHRHIGVLRDISISRCKSFHDLLIQIKIEFLKLARKNIQPFRIWFIDSSNIVTFPLQLSLNQFIFEIEKKSLVQQSMLNDKLIDHSQDNSQFHIMIELAESKGHGSKFPLDIYFDQIDLALYNSNYLLHSGGNLGLNNLGNTCYMNSALQCLLHIPEINYYFFFNLYKQELNKNNPLGYHGDVANSFGSLLKLAFDSSKSSSIAPREFKSTIGRYSSMFSGYMQQDSQELLSWLLDALHEDLNRIHEKPYSEKPELNDDEINDPQARIKLAKTCWDQYKSRNDSVIVDLFTGLYQSTLVCPTCSKTSITFDPYNDLTLPLPISKKWYHTFTIVDLSDKHILGDQNIKKLEVELTKTSNYDQLIKYIADFFSVPSDELFLYEIFRNSFYSDFQLDYHKNKFLPISDLIRDTDDIFVYYIPHDATTDIIVPVFNSAEDSDKSYNFSEMFGIPLFIVLNKETDTTSFGTIRKKIEEKVQILTNANIKEEYDNLKTSSENYVEKEFYSHKDFPNMNNGMEIDDNLDDGYDSDVSFANPYVPADIGFEIKFFNSNSRVASRHRYGHNNLSNLNDSNERVIHAPIYKPNIREFEPLSNKLPELKKKYYHYPNISKEPEPEIQVPVNDDSSALASSESEKLTGDEYVMVEANKDMVQLTDLATVPTLSLLNMSDEENEPQLSSLLDDNIESECSLPPPGPDSLKPSVVNSPIHDTQDLSPSNSVVTNHPILVNKDTILLCDWNSTIYEQFFEGDNKIWMNPALIPNPELKKNKARFEKQRNSKVSLHDCLGAFSTPEVLGEHDLWYCPRCKDHKQATKTIQLWSSGDILTIHLKRFHSARAFSDKIDMLVDFPIEGLDISSYITNPESESNIYDLVAVDNHYGGLGGGHYTSAAQNFRDGKWYYFNDSRVTEITDPRECISPAAYLLFYRRRQSKADSLLGGDDLNQMIHNGREQYQTLLETKKKNLENLQQQIVTYKEYEDQVIKEQKLQQQLEDQAQHKKNNVEFTADDEVNLYSEEDAEADDEELEEEDDDEDIDIDNSRKQRLISKENNNNKLIQIKSNGRQQLTLSPRLSDSVNDNDNDNISECNEI